MGRRTRPENILPGDHDQMTEAQRRGHYSSGCTHELCRRAVNDYEAARQRRKRETRALAPAQQAAEPTTAVAPVDRVPALGSSRRLQGLVFAGHTPVDIARATQISVDAIWWLLLEHHTTVTTTTQRIIDREFKRMRTLVPEPSGKTAADKAAATARSKALAQSQGWSSAFAWTNIDTDDRPTYKTEAGAATKARAEAPGPDPMPEPAPATPEHVEPTPEPAAGVSTPWAEDFRAAVEHLENAARAIAEGLEAIGQ